MLLFCFFSPDSLGKLKHICMPHNHTVNNACVFLFIKKGISFFFAELSWGSESRLHYTLITHVSADIMEI